MESFEQHLPIGSMVDRYRIEKVLGIGGFGVTYLATDTELEYPVAIKEFMPDDCAVRSQSNSQIIAKSNRQEDYQYGLDRFLDEAKTLAKFKHPNIVRVSNFLKANNTAYLVMDYEEGEALDDRLKRIGFTGQMPEADILAILKPILKGLEKVHQQGLLHRDIKPGNIYLRADGEPMLIDFGAARYALGAQSKSISAIVSMGYAPPEQYSSRGKQGPYSDLYALGATVYQLITGKAPEESTLRREAIQEEEPDPLRPLQQQEDLPYSQELLAAVDWCLKLTTKHRPQSAAEVLKALEQGIDANTDQAVTRKISEEQAFGAQQVKAGQAKQEEPEITATGTRRVKEGESFSANKQKAAKPHEPSPSGFSWAPVVITSLVAAAGGGYWWLQQNQEEPNPSKPVASQTAKPADNKPKLPTQKPLAVTIRANIASVQIYIDGQGYYQPGQTLMPGSYPIIADAKGYKSLKQTIQVGPGNTFFQLKLEELPPELYPLMITATPADANIQVLNIGPKYTPGMLLPAGEYRIKLSKTGFNSKVQTVNLSPGQQQFNISLQKPSYRVGQVFQDRLSSGGQGPQMVVLPKGSFQMGSNSGDSDEKPVHRVNINHDIAVMKYEVPFADYDKFSNATGRSRAKDEGWGRGKRPAINVSWNDAVAYAKWLSQQTGKRYRLPSEAEWEYAARAGSQSKYSWGNSINCSQARYGYYSDKCGKQWSTDSVGSFSANNFGLYDMHGNVQEWVADCWHENYQGAPSNGKVWSGGNCEGRILRGSSWADGPSYLRSANRHRASPDDRDLYIGFRLVQDLNP